MTKHAILSQNENVAYLLTGQERTDHINLSNDLEGLCNLALQREFTHLWIHPSTAIRFELRGPEPLLMAAHWDTLANWQYRDQGAPIEDNHLVSLHGYRRFPRGRSPRFNLIFLEYAAFDWGNLAPEEILRMIADLESKLGVSVGGSPAGVGLRYLQKINEKHLQWLAQPDTDLASIPFDRAARPLIWSRPPSEDEQARRYLYKFDENSAYPRAAVEERFGVGDPVHYPMGTGFNHMLPGIWRVDVEFSPDLHPLLPPPVWSNFEWLATPMVKLLVQLGCGIFVNEAWVFPKYEYIFRKWGKNLWEYTQEYERGTSERIAFKQIMNEPLGLVRSKMFGTDSFKFRPDWNSMIVGSTRANVHRKAVKYGLQGHYPIMVQLDALYYLSDEKLPNVAVPGILDHSSSLGGYKLDFCLEVDDQVRNILLTSSGSRRLHALNELAEKAGY